MSKLEERSDSRVGLQHECVNESNASLRWTHTVWSEGFGSYLRQGVERIYVFPLAVLNASNVLVTDYSYFPCSTSQTTVRLMPERLFIRWLTKQKRAQLDPSTQSTWTIVDDTSPFPRSMTFSFPSVGLTPARRNMMEAANDDDWQVLLIYL